MTNKYFSSAGRRTKAAVVSTAAIFALAVSAAPAFASSPANATGTAYSSSTASVACPTATPPAYGEPIDAGIGHKVG